MKECDWEVSAVLVLLVAQDVAAALVQDLFDWRRDRPGQEPSVGPGPLARLALQLLEEPAVIGELSRDRHCLPALDQSEQLRDVDGGQSVGLGRIGTNGAQLQLHVVLGRTGLEQHLHLHPVLAAQLEPGKHDHTDGLQRCAQAASRVHAVVVG